MWSFGKLGLVIRGFRERAGWGGCLLRRDKLFIRFLGGERGGGGFVSLMVVQVLATWFYPLGVECCWYGIESRFRSGGIWASLFFLFEELAPSRSLRLLSVLYPFSSQLGRTWSDFFKNCRDERRSTMVGCDWALGVG